ncbi:MAG: N-acetylglutaminylglutamine amidotransferase [Leptospiraceae bacterium]|nr:N-acetylglutaminylglutamine amidotransferase [Leptospiraceae bacterium]
MCGICGELRFDGQKASAAALDRMSAALAPRGPDGAGFFVNESKGFAHRRLKIIDLSDRANQPMIDEELGLGIVYNGAIYNYPELRKELTALGYTFFSTGDTEVLIKAYHRWGLDFVKRLYGMFAFAIFDLKTGRTVLARDRQGIKPLYYSEISGAFRFASSLTALLAAGQVDTSIDPVALHHYMTFHSVVPPPRTILKGIRKVPPATLMTIEPDGHVTEQRYWELSFQRSPEEENRSFEEWQEASLTALRTSVARRLVADVPVGVLLSGGLDSSLVVALLAEAGQTDLETFSIGFESVGEEAGDEFQYSDRIVERFGTTHHRIRISSGRGLDSLGDCVRAMAEPMVSHDAIGFYLLSQEVSKHIKVVQSGQGADEIFAGYHWYPPMMESSDAVSDYARVFFDQDHADFARAVRPEFVEEDYSRQFVERCFAKSGAPGPVDNALFIDASVMLVDDPVKRVDNMTMAFGLEARVPFLDHDVVELAARIPARFKVGGGGKHVLKEAARSVLPHEVIDRPKGYFPVPALKYLRGPYLEFVNDILDSPRSWSKRLFQKSYLDQLRANPEKHITPLRGSKLWQVALLDFWLQTNNLEP